VSHLRQVLFTVIKRNIIEKKNIKKMEKKLIEVREQIQEDLMTYLDGIDEAVGNEKQEIITKVCQIVVDNFNKLKK
jgi:hypothetical protein